MDEPRNRRGAIFAALLTGILGLGAMVALLTVAVASAVATVFGLGWGVVIVAGAVLVSGAVLLGASHPAWVVLPVAALVIPAAVMIGLHVRLARQIGDVSVAPAAPTAIPARGYRTGIGTLLVDLRHDRFASGSRTTVRIDAGLGRAIVALPHRRCVAVRVDYATHSSLLHAVAGALGDGEGAPITIFGRAHDGGSGTVSDAVAPGRPTVVIDFRSQGGALSVRDYPDSVDPRVFTDWPGTGFVIGPRPRVGSGDGPAARRRRADLREWRSLRADDLRIRRQQPGPCAGEGRS